MIRELTGALLQESGVGMRRDPRNLNPPRAQSHDHQDIVGHQLLHTLRALDRPAG